MEEETKGNAKPAENPVKYDYWTLKDKEFFKGTDKPDTAPKLVSTEPAEVQK
jgi:hypothetical protein